MKKPSPKAHLVRLALVGIVFVTVFISAKNLLTPATWNPDMDNWFRLQALDDMLNIPISYANNTRACAKACHKKVYKKFRKKKHKGLACDACHGSLGDHVDTSKVPIERLLKGKFSSEEKKSLKKADAPFSFGVPASYMAAHEKNGGTVLPEGASVPVVIKDLYRAKVMWQCRNCHLSMINKPKNFKQFRPDPVKFKKHVAFAAGRVKKKDDGKDVMCLSCHDPHDPAP